MPLEHLFLVVLEHLHAQFPFGEGTCLDGIGQVAAVEVGIGAVGEHGLFPDQ